MERLSLLLCVTLFACQTSEQELNSKIDSFFEQNRNSQKFVIEGDSINTIVTKRGAIIEVASHQFGSNVKTPIEVVITEVYDKSDMVYWKLSTNTSDGMYLESNAMLNIQFYSEGDNIELDHGKNLAVKLPRSESLYDYNVYQGSSKNNTIQWDLLEVARTDTFIYKTTEELRFDYGGDGTVINTYYISRKDTLYKTQEILYPDNYPFDSVVDSVSGQSPLQESIYFMCYVSELEWINIDKLMETDSTETLLVKSDTSFQQEHFLIFKDRNSVLSSFGEPNLVFDKIPLHEELELLSVAERNDTLMYSYIEFRLDSSMELFTKYSPISEAELKILIGRLDKKRS